MITIDQNWRPPKKSSNALLNDGYSQEQLNKTGKIFIERNWGKQLDNAGSLFTKMVRSSGAGHNVKVKPDTTLDDIKERRSHKSDKSEQRAKEVKESSERLTQDQAIAEYNRRRM